MRAAEIAIRRLSCLSERERKEAFFLDLETSIIGDVTKLKREREREKGGGKARTEEGQS